LPKTFSDEQAQTLFELLREKHFSDQSRSEKLNERETTIMSERFGLNGTAGKLLEHVAELVGVTHERVRRLELAELAKLRRAFKHLDPLEA
jgi:DNA-directed RNA polymerase sigma subunit (sigma70/sigma32)